MLPIFSLTPSFIIILLLQGRSKIITIVLPRFLTLRVTLTLTSGFPQSPLSYYASFCLSLWVIFLFALCFSFCLEKGTGMFMNWKGRWTSTLSSQSLLGVWGASLFHLWMSSLRWGVPHQNTGIALPLPLFYPMTTRTCSFRASVTIQKKQKQSKARVAIYWAVISSVKRPWNWKNKSLRRPFIASSMNGPPKAETLRGLIWMTNHPQPNSPFPFPPLLKIFQLSIPEPIKVNRTLCGFLRLFFLVLLNYTNPKKGELSFFLKLAFDFADGWAFNSGSLIKGQYCNYRGGVHSDPLRSSIACPFILL